jgi:hypothetical protein
MPDFGIMRGFNDKLFGDKLYAGQLPTQLGLIGSQEVNDFDADALAFFQRVSDATGTLSLTEKQAVNQLVLDLKANSLWTPMKAIYPMVGASAAACAQNLKSASFTGTFTSGWTFASTGVTPNGTSAYMNTAFTPSSSLSVDSVHGSLYLNTNNVGTGDPVDFGSFNLIGQALTLTQSSLGTLLFASRNLASVISTTQVTRLGFGITSKTSATLTTLYKNGTSVISGNSGGTLPTYSSYLGALNLQGNFYGATNNRIAFHSLGDGLTSTQASNFYTAVQSFQTTLSRQV